VTAAAACAGALGAGLLLLARSRWQLLGGLALVAVASAGLAAAFLGEIGGLDRGSVSMSAGVVIAVVVAGLVLAAIAAVLVRFPAAVVPLLLVTAPLRPPLDPDPSAPLLVTVRPDALVGYHLPLYAVLVAAALALAWRAVRGEELRPLPRRFAYPAGALVALTSLSLLWSLDVEEGINQVLLFWLPYTVLAVVVVHSPFPEWMPRALAWTAVGLGCVFALVGLGQVVAGEIFFSTPALAQANATTELFRVTSLFQDPSIYGRELVVAMAVVLVALWLGRVRMPAGLAVLVLLVAALLFTYSQSSLAALAIVAVAVAAAAGDRRVRGLVGALVAAAAITGVALLGVAVADGPLADVSRNRSALVVDTGTVFANHPFVGVGVGGQPVATRDEADTGVSVGQSTSHTTPLTIAAELGVLGLAAYLALLAGAASILRDLHRRDPATALGLAAVLLVLFVHALIYEGFFETALGFGAIGVACAALRREPDREPEPTVERVGGARPATT
jgi:hypothetical protein